MKNKIVLAFACSIAITSTVHAQVKKGSILLGGSVGISSQKKNYEGSAQKEKLNNLFLNPAVGKAIKDNLILGADIQFYYRDVNNTPAYDKWTSIGAGLFLRKYWEVLNRFYIFGQGRLGGSYNTATYFVAGGHYNESSGYSIGVSATPGISYAVSRRVHLESSFANLLSANYNHERGSSASGSTIFNKYKSNSFNFTGAFSNETEFTLGVRVLLSRS